MQIKLIAGQGDKTEHLFPKKPGFLFVGDGIAVDAFMDRYKRAKLFDPTLHSFNPLPMKYKDARDFASVLYGDHGKGTLTAARVQSGLTSLLMTGDRLDRLKPTSPEEKEAMLVINDLLLSPVLRSVFCTTTNFSIKDGNPPSSIVAKLDRSKIGAHDARILGAVLISQFPRQIVVEDFGFYARDFHASLVRENRLIAGVYTLAELEPKLLQMCLLMEKIGVECNYPDAKVLAEYEGLVPRTEGFNARIKALTAPQRVVTRQYGPLRIKRPIMRPAPKQRPKPLAANDDLTD